LSQRAGCILFFSFAGAVAGFYTAMGYEWFLGDGMSDWPTAPMIWLPIVGFIGGYFLIRSSFPPPSQERCWEDLPCPVFYNVDHVRDVLIDRAYGQESSPAGSQAALIQERMYMIRTGRVRVPRGKNHGEAFKELMEGSDPLDT
jgi:hypothetical protein